MRLVESCPVLIGKKNRLFARSIRDHGPTWSLYRVCFWARKTMAPTVLSIRMISKGAYFREDLFVIFLFLLLLYELD